MNIQHSSRSDSWGGPADIVESARSVLGGIDFDPCSSADFNKVVRARNFYTKEDDSLANDWPTTREHSVYLNPPGGKLKNMSMTALFWDKLHTQEFSHAIFMGFSLECLQTTQRGGVTILQFPICVPRKRLRFNKEDGAPGAAPSHSNVIVYVPRSVDNTAGFMAEFSKYGFVKL